MEFNYLSLESVLAEEGMISQMPFVMTFVTTGRSGKIDTAFGTIEFRKTSRDWRILREQVKYDEQRGIYVATAERALADLRRSGRNMDLVIQ